MPLKAVVPQVDGSEMDLEEAIETYRDRPTGPKFSAAAARVADEARTAEEQVGVPKPIERGRRAGRVIDPWD